jgi:acetolactate synthase-1/3 small subunit
LSGDGAADLSEDAYDTPDSAPPVARSTASRRRSMEVATSIAENVRQDKEASEDASARLHTLAVLVDNESGVLSRVSGLLSARGYNIDSLTVSPTNLPDMSRMTIVIRGVPPAKAAQALKQLEDLVNVWAAVDYTGTNSLQRELVMVKVGIMPDSGAGKLGKAVQRPSYAELLAAQSHRAAVRDLGELFGAEVVDVGSRHIVFQLTSWSRRIDAFIKMLEPWGVIEVARSGVVAMLRSPVAGSLSLVERKKEEVDLASLPPG